MPLSQVHRTGSITRVGRSDLRTILVEAAWTTIRMPAAKAIVAIARKLLAVIWQGLARAGG